MTEHRVDTIVVGAGMVGATAALQLKRQLPDARVALVAPPADDTTGEETFDPRVVALTEASRSLLDELGLWSALAARRVCPYRRMHVWDGEGGGAITFDSDELGADVLGHIVENRAVVAALTDAIARSDIVRVEGRVAALATTGQTVDGVVLDDGSALRAPLTLAADGARSPLRELAAIDVRQWSYGQSAIVTTVQTQLCHEFTARQRFMRTGPLAFLPLCQSMDETAPRHSSIVWSADQPLADELMALTDDDFAERLGAAFERRLGAVQSVAKRYALPLHQRHAKTYVRPGLALLGDAAHSIHPLAGQGVNLGLLDVRALVAEIERAHQRGVCVGDSATLRRYERRRMGHNLSVMAAMEGFKRLFGAQDLGLLWLRNRGLDRVDSLPGLKRLLARQAMGLAL